MLKANVPESSAIAELLAVAISASADALALAAGVVLAAAMPTAFAAFLSFVISASADALAVADLPAFAFVLNPLPRRWA